MLLSKFVLVKQLGPDENLILIAQITELTYEPTNVIPIRKRHKTMMRWDNGRLGKAPILVNVSDQLDLLSKVDDAIQHDRGFSIATINLDHVVKLRTDEEFAEAYRSHTFVTADGNPIVWLCHVSGQRNVSLVPGSELILPIARLAAKRDVPVGMFGSTDSSLDLASDALREKTPGVKVSLKLSPAMGFDPEGIEAVEAIEAINQSGVKIVYLALGAPKQERFAAFAQSRLPQVGFLSIGAGLDFISGEQTRAPLMVRRLYLEWLWRMLGNPRRLFARYLACIIALPKLSLRAVRSRIASSQ